MKITLREYRFLLFFLPVFFLKFLDFSASDKIFVITSIVCFVIMVIGIVQEKYAWTKLLFFCMLVVYTGVLVITCGKQGAFFSAVTIMALDKINPKRNIYKCLLWAGTIGMLLSCYMQRKGILTIRYIGGEWTEVYKRSNILSVYLLALICLYLYAQESKRLSLYKIFIIAVLTYAMYKYTGSRTGLISLVVLLTLLISFRYKLFYKNVIIKWLCIISPLIGMISSFFCSYQYGKWPIINTLNSMLQGRLALGKKFLDRYELKLLGQHIFESTDQSNYAVLDCAYLDMLICYGVLFALLWLLVSCITIKYLYERERYIEVATIIAYAVYGISEAFLPNCYLNVSIFLYAECIFFFLDKHQSSKMEELHDT